jgi:hypothetical protein
MGKKKRPEMVKGGWFFNWNNAPVFTTLPLLIKISWPPPESRKTENFGLYLSQVSLKTAWEEVIRGIAKLELTAVFRRLFMQRSKCILYIFRATLSRKVGK